MVSSFDFNNSEILWTLGICILILLGVTGYLFYAFLSKEETIHKMKRDFEKLMLSFENLDQQARLIVHSDLELNLAREGLDKRLDGLNSLQKTSRQISQAISETEIFQKISTSLFDHLGFARALIATVDDQGHWRLRLNIGFNESASANILKELEQNLGLKNAFKESASLSSLNSPAAPKKILIQAFGVEHFVFCPIRIQNGPVGFVFAGNHQSSPPVVQSDEELISILAGQIGQSIENAQLFEKVFHSSQEMELKVKERTKELARALEKVEEINKKKSEFISAVSHELRTPLTSIKGYASLLMAGKIGEIPQAVKERLEKINIHSDSLVNLINNLLDIARIESGRQEMKFSLYKAKLIVDNVVDLLHPQMASKNIQWHVLIPLEIDTLYIDSSQVERVFINLLGNAIKFTPSGGTITIKAAAVENGFCLFTVTDTGIGIPASEIQKLFSEFFRVDNEINQHVKGTGLGLVLAKNIVQAHHGKIWATSSPEAGTTFHFTLACSKEAFDKNKLIAPP